MERYASRRARQGYLLVSVLTNLGILATFKYFNFSRDSVMSLLGAFGLYADVPAINVILPMGISFYTFQTMSYTIDVYHGAPAVSLQSAARRHERETPMCPATYET